MLEINVSLRRVGSVVVGVGVGEPVGDVLSVAVIEILGFHHEVLFAERIEPVGHGDAVAENVGDGKEGQVGSIGQHGGINDVLCRSRACDHQI